MTTQTEHPWRTVARSAVQIIIGLAAAAPLIYQAIAQDDPTLATGGAAVALGVAGAITRLMALPVVETALRQILPWLAAAPGDTGDSGT